jgi:hypothetical protein
MSYLEQEPMGSHTNPERHAKLESAVAALAKDFKKTGVYEIADRELVEKTMAPESGGKISGRTALITEKVLTSYVSRLKKENRELEARIESRKDVNEQEALEQIRKNNDEIAMIEGNCLNSLAEINNFVLSTNSKN